MMELQRRIWRNGERWLVALLLAAFVGLALVYAWAIPLFEGPDEYAHLEYIDYLLSAKQLPPFDAATAHISHQLVQQPPLFYALAAAVIGWTPVDVSLAHAAINPYVSKNKSHRAYITLPNAPVGSEWAPRGARMVSLLGATLAVMGTWLLARRLLPDWAWAAYVAAAIVAFNPQFLFSAATITNDTWAAALPVWALWLALGAADRARPWRVWFGVGLLLGAATLVKYSALAVVVPLGMVGMLQIYQQGWRDGRTLNISALNISALNTSVLNTLALNVGAALLGFVLVAGWWLLRNMLVAGALFPLQQMVMLQPAMAWPALRAWNDPELWTGARWLLRSYWGVFGYGIIAPASYHRVVQNMLLVALGGYGIWGMRTVLARGNRQVGRPLLLAIGWAMFAFVALLNWMRAMRFTDQGRLLFPAAPALALLIVLGWAAWLPRRWQGIGAVVAVGLMMGLGTSQLATLHAEYAMPRSLVGPLVTDRPIEARFAAGMTLLGVDLPQGAALDAGGTLPLTLYWTTDAMISENYTLFIHLADRDNTLLYQFDGVPFSGRHPTRQWLPGQRFADTYMITVPRSRMEEGLDKLAILSVGFYPVEAINQRQAVTALATGAQLGDRLTLATVRVHAHPQPEAPTSIPVARWQQGITLDAFSVTPDVAGVPAQVMLRWHATQPLHADYTVFVQLLDAYNQVVAQVDHQPQAGAWPTSTWRAGDVIEETIQLPAPVGAWDQLIIGLYDQSGVLMLVEPEVQGYFALAHAE